MPYSARQLNKVVEKRDTIENRENAFHLYKTALGFCKCDSSKAIKWDDRGVITKVGIDSIKK